MARETGSVPKVPLGLGLAGLIPFWGLAFGVALHGVFGISTEPLDLALATYGAIIVSFLGGIRWGLMVGAEAARSADSADADRRDGDYAVSIVPSLLAWAALAAPEPWRLGLLALIAASLGPIDLGLVRAGLAPAWFGRLRLILSTGAGVALAFAAVSIR